MPTNVNNNPVRALATGIVEDAKARGLSSDQLMDLGRELMERMDGAAMTFGGLPAVRNHVMLLGNALTIAADQLAANTLPPTVDDGVTA